ncbi:UvrB/UvrC motif-containing protein [Sphingomonas sp.]|uniref:UvrB/UvrC motif-containing protein n=1 Tax=Sphingomonas sp. TaxID=28214 RepID=UPI002FD8890E
MDDAVAALDSETAARCRDRISAMPGAALQPRRRKPRASKGLRARPQAPWDWEPASKGWSRPPAGILRPSLIR